MFIGESVNEKEAYRASASRKTVLYFASASFDLASSWNGEVVVDFDIFWFMKEN